MVAVYLIKNSKLNIVIVAPTCYLTGRSYNQFRAMFSLLDVPVTLEVLGGRVCFITMKNLVLTQAFDLKQYALLIDEIDRDVFDQVIERKAV